MALHTIGDVARLAGVSTKAIRFWEERGLLTDINRTPSGYRTFNDDDLATIRFIQQSQLIGLTLKQILDILGIHRTAATPCEYVIHTLDDHILEVDRKLTEIGQLRDTLHMIRNRVEDKDFIQSNATICGIIEGFNQEGRDAP